MPWFPGGHESCGKHIPAAQGGQQLRNRTVANGHIVEEPAEQSTGIDHVVEEFLAGDVLVVNRGVTGGNTKCQTILFQQPHGICNFIINSLAPAGIVGFCKTFQRNGGDKVLHPQHFLAEFLIDEGAVGKGQEGTVGMHLTDLEQICLADSGLTTGIDIHVSTQFLALTDDGVDGFHGKIQTVTILCRPATGTVQVAG